MAPVETASQNTGPKLGRAPGDSAATSAQTASENGSPNRNRTSVAPHGPASSMIPRCKALRATWKPAAPMVMGIQSMLALPSRSTGGVGGGWLPDTGQWRAVSEGVESPPYPTPSPRGKGLCLEPAPSPFLPGREVVQRVDQAIALAVRVSVSARRGGDAAVEPHRDLGLGSAPRSRTWCTRGAAAWRVAALISYDTL